jgi:hypothetical protein
MTKTPVLAATFLLALAAPALAAKKPPASGGSTAPAQVFAPNPVADLGIQTLTDQKDADFFSADPELARAYHRVTLTDLDGTGTLSGTYARSSARPASRPRTPEPGSSTRVTRTSSSR